nr:type II toxin-antitoxin system antitoxin SocA domain-containing protein [Mycoplasmopsis agalactiae]
MLDDGILKDTAFQAWIHGPVSPELWKDYRDYGWNEIEKKAFDESKLDKNVLELLDAVWTTYGDKSGYELKLFHILKNHEKMQERVWENSKHQID